MRATGLKKDSEKLFPCTVTRRMNGTELMHCLNSQCGANGADVDTPLTRKHTHTLARIHTHTHSESLYKSTGGLIKQVCECVCV